MNSEYIGVDGDLALLDFDAPEKDVADRDRLYCIAYAPPDDDECPLMLIWRRGESIYSRTIGHHPDFGKRVGHITSFAHLTEVAHELLRKES